MDELSQWLWAKTNGHLLPTVEDNPERFMINIGRGMALAPKALAVMTENRPFLSTLSCVRVSHRALFGEVFNFAGRIRVDRIGNGDIWPAWSSRIEPEFHRLANAAASLLATSKTVEEKAHAIALYVGQLWRIQLFRDGNTRATCTLGLALADKHLDRRIDEVDPEPYKEALHAFAETGHLQGLAHHLCDVALCGALERTSYKHAVWPAPIEVLRPDGSMEQRVLADPEEAAEFIEYNSIARDHQEYCESRTLLSLEKRMGRDFGGP